MPSSRAAFTTARHWSRSSFMPKLFVPSPTTDTTRPEFPRRLNSMPRRYPAGLERLQDVLHPFLGVAEEHLAVLAEEQRILYAGVSGRHGPLEDDHVLRLPDVQHRHAGDRRAGVLGRRRVDGVVRADD